MNRWSWFRSGRPASGSEAPRRNTRIPPTTPPLRRGMALKRWIRGSPSPLRMLVSHSVTLPSTTSWIRSSVLVRSAGRTQSRRSVPQRRSRGRAKAPHPTGFTSLIRPMPSRIRTPMGDSEKRGVRGVFSAISSRAERASVCVRPRDRATKPEQPESTAADHHSFSIGRLGSSVWMEAPRTAFSGNRERGSPQGRYGPRSRCERPSRSLPPVRSSAPRRSRSISFRRA